ncbi:exodeoxyribonuclease I [Actinobacillus delphinicola]|uniref:Exodeoxyribonuclease I n=1 Tax=Actinobacillus delphinicola TaxID=51161 RepID=A0A448TVW9_9PAST|nr:exodeoxyribonuclease I [Actinobacillus delphinicola]VEJ10070.1 exonuclease I [Actinobacillus delphinicola]
MSNDFSFFIYDYESFGIDPARDRPAQFGGIRTDENFNIIGEPVMFYCQQTNDYLPSPDAVMVTGITPQECNEKGVPEYEFADKILAEFSQPNTCIMGYNNIRYDDEMTRYTFYRNLRDPYAYSYKNGNSRWDLLDLVRACYALRPEGINWVYDDDGLPSFRLELLTKANGIEHSHAHDAMADVYATLEMAKLIKQKQPRLFDFYFKNRDKKNVEKMMDTATLTPLVHVSGMFGNARSNVSVIVPLAWDLKNKNLVHCCDLMGDVEAMLQRPAEENQQILYTKRTELEEQGIAPVPLKGVHINKCPFIAPLNTLRPQDLERLGIDMEKCQRNLALLREYAYIRDFTLDICGAEREYPADENVETALYSGFFSRNDMNNLAILRTLPVEKWDDCGLKFEDPRIPQLLFHFKARYFFKNLSRPEQIKWKKYRLNKIEQKAAEFEARFYDLHQENLGNEEKMNLLSELQLYVMKLFA